MKRLAALLAALAMVAGALVLRDRLQGGGTGNGDGGDPTEAKGAVRLACPTELRDACNAARSAGAVGSVVVEPAGTTYDRLVALDFQPATANFDVWLVPSAWVRMVAVRADVGGAAAPALGTPSNPLARSALVLAGPPAKLDPLAATCVDSLSLWSCLADRAASRQPGGAVRLGLDAPELSLAGPALLGQAAVGLSGRADVATNDLDAIRNDLTALRTSVSREGSPTLSAVGDLVTRASALDVAVTTAAQATLVTAGGNLRALPLTPPARVDLVLVAVAGKALPSRDRQSALGRSLMKAGWEAPDSSAANDGLPAGGTLVALRNLWLGKA